MTRGLIDRVQHSKILNALLMQELDETPTRPAKLVL
jgi:hypothetical protein